MSVTAMVEVGEASTIRSTSGLLVVWVDLG